jgi:hypothetical protein
LKLLFALVIATAQPLFGENLAGQRSHIAGIPAQARATEALWTCDLHDEIVRKEVVSELAVLGGKIAISASEIQHQYETETNDGYLRNRLLVGLNAAGRKLKPFAEIHYSYTHSSVSGKDGAAAISSAVASHIFAALPGASSAVFAAVPKIYFDLALVNHERLLYRVTGRTLASFGATGVVSVISGEVSLRSSLVQSNSGLSLDSQRRLNSDLLEPIERTIEHFSKILDWKPEQRDAFKKALRKRIVDGMVIAVRNDSPNTARSFKPQLFIEKFPEIDILKLMETEGLVTPPQLEGLRFLEKTSKQADELSLENSSRGNRMILGNGSSEDMAKITATIRTLISAETALNKLMKDSNRASRNDLAGPSVDLDREIAYILKLLHPISSALSIIRQMCSLGELPGAERDGGP